MVWWAAGVAGLGVLAVWNGVRGLFRLVRVVFWLARGLQTVWMPAFVWA